MDQIRSSPSSNTPKVSYSPSSMWLTAQTNAESTQNRRLRWLSFDSFIRFHWAHESLSSFLGWFLSVSHPALQSKLMWFTTIQMTLLEHRDDILWYKCIQNHLAFRFAPVYHLVIRYALTVPRPYIYRFVVFIQWPRPLVDLLPSIDSVSTFRVSRSAQWTVNFD